MSCVGVNRIKEEPQWEDYCISEAQAWAAARAVKPEPGPELPGSCAGPPDYSIHSQLNSIKGSDTEQNNNAPVNVKEESGEKACPQELTGLYEENINADKLKTPLDLYSGTSEKLETDASEEPKTVPPAFQEPKIVNPRQDLMVINNIAQEVNRKRVIVKENISRPITKYVCTPNQSNQQPVMPVKTNSQCKKPYVLNKVTINPEIGLLSQPSMVANALLKNNVVSVSDSAKKQPSTFASQAYNRIPLLNSVAYNNPEIPRAMVPIPCPQRRATESSKQPLPTGVFRPINVPVTQPLPKGIIQPITVPISQLNGKVSLKPLEKSLPKTTTSIPKLRPVPISKLQSDTTSKLQPGTISQLRLDSISKLQPGTISKLRPDSVSNPGTIPKLQSSTIPTFKTNVLDSQTGPPNFIPIVSNPFDNVNVYQKVPDGNDIKRITITGALKSNITTTPNSKPTPMIPTNFPRIPISKPINSQIPEAFANMLTPKIINGDKQSATRNNSNIQRIVTLTPRTFPKPVNSQIAKPIHNHIPQNENAATQNNSDIQRRATLAYRTFPKTVNSQIAKPIHNHIPQNENAATQNNSDIQRRATLAYRTFPKPVNSQIAKPIHNHIPQNENAATQNNSDIQRRATLAYRTFPKTVNSQIAKPIHNHITQNENGYRKAKVYQNCNVQRLEPKTVPKVSGPENSLISNDIIPDDRQVVAQNLPPNSKTASDASDKVVNLEDFLIPSYVVLERMKKRTCEDCDKTFYEHKAFIDHTKTSEKWKKTVSNFLGNDRGTGNDTTKIDSSLPSLTCQYCQKLFFKHNVLYYHVRRNHICRRRKFQCDYCGKKCLERCHLINHIRTHTGEKPFKCLICKTRHRTASNLTSHNINMHGTKKHFCPICNRPFNMSSNMKKHIRTHSGERPYVCVTCKKRFVQKHHLARHMESHLDIRRYPCNYCKMRFLRKAHLDRHKKNIHKKKRSHKKSRQKAIANEPKN